MNSLKLLKHFFVIIILFSVVFAACGKEEIPKSSLIIKDNLLYKEGSNVPFTGREKALVENKIVEYDVKDGVKHGEFRIYSEEGNIEIKGQLDSNRNVGKWQYFYPNGEIESEGYFNLDHPDGKWIWNYSDGKRKEEGEYINGNRVGVWYQYDDNGKIIFEYNYELGDTTQDSTST
jgi:antitoxin component YwqK of YwqJK toxin-antitoxin module